FAPVFQIGGSGKFDRERGELRIVRFVGHHKSIFSAADRTVKQMLLLLLNSDFRGPMMQVLRLEKCHIVPTARYKPRGKGIQRSLMNQRRGQTVTFTETRQLAA